MVSMNSISALRGGGVGGRVVCRRAARRFMVWSGCVGFGNSVASQSTSHVTAFCYSRLGNTRCYCKARKRIVRLTRRRVHKFSFFLSFFRKVLPPRRGHDPPIVWLFVFSDMLWRPRMTQRDFPTRHAHPTDTPDEKPRLYRVL